MIISFGTHYEVKQSLAIDIQWTAFNEDILLLSGNLQSLTEQLDIIQINHTTTLENGVFPNRLDLQWNIKQITYTFGIIQIEIIVLVTWWW